MRESKEDDAFDVYLRFKEYSEIPWPEHRVDKWFRMFHETLGFEWIMPKPSPGDYLGLKDGTEGCSDMGIWGEC